ncbi:MAG TPA: cytochrome c3 family protein [Geomonas sp.]|nr:cytochrome c3 family protein [Geomonas sp.]
MFSNKVLAAAALAAALLVGGHGAVFAKQSVVNSPHNLSASGGLGAHKIAYDEIRICVFCHTPHNAINVGGIAPLWNRPLPSGQGYTMYQSPTFSQNVTVQPSVPTGASRICLSCHDGTLALNMYGGRVLPSGSVSGTSPYSMPTDTNPALNANLGTDLSDDHPISFNYNSAVTATNTNQPSGSQLALASSLPPAIKLDQNGNLECTACHDPHDNEYGNFLVMNNGDSTKPDYNSTTPSPLCITCHLEPGWDTSSHNVDNGCLNCHVTHTSPVKEYLLSAPVSDLCYSANCHGTSNPTTHTARSLISQSVQAGSTFGAGHGQDVGPARKPGANLQTVFSQSLYKHPVGTSTSSYKANQPLPLKQPRVECVDCHSAHVAGSKSVMAGQIKSSLKKVRGISRESMSTVTATSEYQICYKCHSGSSAYKFLEINKPNRVIHEFDQLKRFDPANPSFHPVAALRRGNGASLLAQYQNTMLTIECSDCHNSDQSKKAGGSGPNGPHGSRYEHILMARYDMPIKGGMGRGSNCSSYQADYALCFVCHSENYVVVNGSYFSNNGVNEHSKHVVDRCVPCFACHDPHGVPMVDGANSLNNAHLINFDKGYTVSQLVPLPRYTSLSPGLGTCTVACHTTNDPGLPPFTHRYTR